MPTSGYLNYHQLTLWLQEVARRWPRWIRLSSLGQTLEGREIWLLTVTDWDTGTDLDRSALWVDGNLHATELCGANACMHLVEELMQRHQDLLGQVAFYVVPRLCPDGAERALAADPQFLRSSPRLYPFADPIGQGVEPADLDGDGKVLWMRLEDPNGPWKACPEEPRLMVRRDPADRQGPFYRLLPEGHWRGEYDGLRPQLGPPRQTLDLNRNFPFKWRPENEQAGAGEFPASEPEVQHCVRFLSQHRNVCQAITYHTFSGVLLRPYSTEPDESLPKADLDNYKFFGERGSEWTGYPLLCVYHDFRYTPKDVITGTFDDWVYDTLGAYAWTVEIWSALRQAGISKGLDRSAKRGEHRFISWFEQHPVAEEIQLLHFCQRELQGQGFVDWKPFDHPVLGRVEIGGWDMFYLFRNPPPQFLAQELEPLSRWVIWMAQANPRLEVTAQEVFPLGADLYRLRLVVDNRGWLPTQGSRKALDRKVVRGIRVLLHLSEPDQLVEGELQQERGQLEGVSARPESPFWVKGDAADQRLVVSWVVRVDPSSKIPWTVTHERAGTIRGQFNISTTNLPNQATSVAK